MKLAEFLEMARTAQRLDVEVLSPRGDVLLSAKGPSAEEVLAGIAGDAETMSARTTHEYVVTARGEQGQVSRHRERVRGGKRDEDDEHKVDPDKLATPGQALGHMVRICSDLAKTVMAQSKEIANMRNEERRDLWQFREKYLESEGELGLAKMHLEMGERKAKVIGDRVDKWLDKGEGLVRGLLVGKGKLGPAEGQSAIAKLRASITAPQRGRLREILGSSRMEAIAWAESPEQLADVLLDQVETAEMELLMKVLSGDQQRDIVLLCKPRWEERTKKPEPPQEDKPNAQEQQQQTT